LNFFSIFKRNLIFKLKKKINIDRDIFHKDVNLEQLFSHYETDKAKLIKKNNISGHGYSEFYEKYLSKLKNKKLNILEIGSYSGSSAAAFSKYFPNSKIYCLDVNLRNFLYKSKQIYPYGLDVTNLSSVKNFLKKIEFDKKIFFFDIIIDDGSHILSHQLRSLDYFFKFVKKGGFYIVEDYKFPEYFKHLKDVDDPTLRIIIDEIRKKKISELKHISTESINELSKNINNIYEHKGYKEISDIMFIEKLN